MVIKGGSIISVAERIDYVIRLLSGSNIITQKMAKNLELDTEQTSLLLSRYVSNPNDSTQKSIAVFQEENTFLKPEEELYFEGYKDQFLTYERLFKIAFVLKKLKTQPTDLTYLFRQKSDKQFGIIDLNELPFELVEESNLETESI